MCDVLNMSQCTGDYGVPDCVLQSDSQYMTIEMHTDSFMQGPGFRATHIGIDGAKDPGLNSKRIITQDSFVETPRLRYIYIAIDIKILASKLATHACNSRQ